MLNICVIKNRPLRYNNLNTWKDQNIAVNSQTGDNYWSLATVEPLGFLPKFQYQSGGRWTHFIALPSLQLYDVYNLILCLTLKQTSCSDCLVLIKESTSFLKFMNIKKFFYQVQFC
jgi:hypothetical protein